MEVYNYVDEIPDYLPFIIDAEVELKDLKIYKKKRMIQEPNRNNQAETIPPELN